MSVTIRPAVDGDIETLAAFNRAIALETEGLRLLVATSVSGVRRGMQQGQEVTYLVARDDDQTVGSLMMTREWSDWGDAWNYWLQSVYVVPPARGRGVFRSLLDGALGHLHDRGDVGKLRLYVETDNETAIATYLRTGFVKSGYQVLQRKLT